MQSGGPGPGVYTVDLGNTHGSLAYVEGPRFEPLGRWSRQGRGEADELSQLLLRAPKRGDSTKLAAVSSVGQPERDAPILAALGAAGCETLHHPEPGLELAIESKETCGMDRQYAMVGALWLGGAAVTQALVVDAGTAVTVDAGSAPAGSDAAATFLGGAIALGPGSLAGAMTAAGARLPEFSVDPGDHALGKSTVEALRSGVVVGFRGAVRELCGAIVLEAFGSREGVHAFVTGGARDYAVGAVESLFPGRVTVDPWLVHRGLAQAARAHGSTP